MFAVFDAWGVSKTLCFDLGRLKNLVLSQVFAACEAWGVSRALCFHMVFAVFEAWGVSNILCFQSFYCLRGLGRFKAHVFA